MFDISFSELMVITVVALVVIGPEKLPKVAKTLGTIVGKVQRQLSAIKEEVNREASFEELQKLQQNLQQQSISAQNSLLASAAEIKTKRNLAPKALVPEMSEKVKKPRASKKQISAENQAEPQKSATKKRQTKTVKSPSPKSTSS